MLYEFELDHNAAEVTKNIYRVKGEGAVNHNEMGLEISLWLQESWRSGRLKTMDSEVVSQRHRCISVTFTTSEKLPELMSHALSYLPTPPLGQDMTQGQFLSGV